MCTTSCKVCNLLFLLHKTLRTAKGCCTRCACNNMDARVTSIGCLVENLTFQALSSTLYMISPMTGMHGNQASNDAWASTARPSNFFSQVKGCQLNYIIWPQYFALCQPGLHEKNMTSNVTSLLSIIHPTAGHICCESVTPGSAHTCTDVL